ncbi:uncharacterized protein BDR25DRAFT_363580 [Lindgomyces ingoldianus]|uniref:Uncharacterized protein n=1 Tax=Lindgomyces ingoldianus TaxID=673940 RepID=A0ACB6Q7B5_9PLEO|nr:uncharacterized protein BDR25DRAFT_363580 [Lindgomyces ingoldianus]KAF2462738.1 hypothetical protein BDR25DRAFT_363580 [Lindgomyces ingoldianus]
MSGWHRYYETFGSGKCWVKNGNESAAIYRTSPYRLIIHPNSLHSLLSHNSSYPGSQDSRRTREVGPYNRSSLNIRSQICASVLGRLSDHPGPLLSLVFPRLRHSYGWLVNRIQIRDISHELQTQTRVHSLRKFLLLHLLPRLIYAISYSILEGGTQFITYNGSISGTFTSASNSSCGTGPPFYFDNLVNTSLRIGVNPPWDTNPFFFEFAHDGNNWQILESDQPVYLKDISASTRSAAKDGRRCGTYENSPWYYVSAEIVNLSAATITITTSVLQGTKDPVPLYVVEGDEKTWISNGMVENESSDACSEGFSFHCGNAVIFTDNLNFTNTSSAALFTLSAPSGNISLAFSGSRIDHNDQNSEPQNNGNYTAISLADPRDNATPLFTFANGTHIKWKGGSGTIWSAVSDASQERGDRGNCFELFWAVKVDGDWSIMTTQEHKDSKNLLEKIFLFLIKYKWLSLDIDQFITAARLFQKLNDSIFFDGSLNGDQPTNGRTHRTILYSKISWKSVDRSCIAPMPLFLTKTQMITPCC